MYLILWAIPIFWVTMFIEWRLSQDHDVKGYELKDSATSLSMGMGNLLVLFFSKFVALSRAHTRAQSRAARLRYERGGAARGPCRRGQRRRPPRAQVREDWTGLALPLLGAAHGALAEPAE